jgi:hypothetical protein
MVKAKKKSIRNNIDILIGIAVILLILAWFYYYNFYIKAGYTQQSLASVNNQTQSSQESSVNSCANVVCNDYCNGNIRYYDGYCENGQCKYNSDYCQNGCSNGLCNQPTPKQSCENAGNKWCNNQCYNQCPTGQRFNCPSYGNPNCIVTRSIEENEKSIVFMMYNGVVTTSNGDVSIPQYGSGVIYSQDGNKVYVMTSRHVIDCWFSGSCRYANVPKRSENITIRTNGGTFYSPTTIMFAPHNLDLAIMTFESTSNDFLPAKIDSSYTPKIGDSVVAIGYPAIVSYPTVLEFSRTRGTITGYKDLLTADGFSFNAIETDAIAKPGSSGGGLFKSDDGSLIGIVTWKDYTSQSTLAIDIKIQSTINQFYYCQSGYFLGTDSKCYPYCPVGYVINSEDGQCHQTCGNPLVYCKSGYSCCNGSCLGCPSGQYLGTDCLCYYYPSTPWG